MIVIPAIDIREGCCVQLAGGATNTELVRLPDAVGVAREFARVGFTRLHLTDLDAATGRGANQRIVQDIIRDSGLAVQVGGGLRDEDRVSLTLESGAAWAVVGTRALRDFDWLADIASAWPGEIILAADVKNHRVTTHGWSRTLPLNGAELVEEVSSLPLGGILVTAVDREGRLQGPDLRLIEDVVEATTLPILASGGIATIADLRSVEDRGAAGAVVGTALYVGALNAHAVASEFGT